MHDFLSPSTLSKPLRLIFYGTPEFGIPSLDLLRCNGYEFPAIVTAPDKPAGRGRKIQITPVKEYALEHGLRILQPTNLKAPEFIDTLKEINPDLQLVIAFRMMPRVVWELPPIGTFNLHASLLPQYRGAAPINWAIINGEKETGLTTFFLQHQIDTGDILFSKKVEINEEDNAGTLHDKLMMIGADLVLQTVQAIESGTAIPHPQNVMDELKKAPKIFKENCKIDWSKSIAEIHNFVRGLSPHPTAWTTVKDSENKSFNLKIYKTICEEISHEFEVGINVPIPASPIRIASKGGFLHLKEIQMESRNKMNDIEFVRGLKNNYELRIGN